MLVLLVDGTALLTTQPPLSVSNFLPPTRMKAFIKDRCPYFNRGYLNEITPVRGNYTCSNVLKVELYKTITTYQIGDLHGDLYIRSTAQVELGDNTFSPLRSVLRKTKLKINDGSLYLYQLTQTSMTDYATTLTNTVNGKRKQNAPHQI